MALINELDDGSVIPEANTHSDHEILTDGSGELLERVERRP
jgi:hypothetical protein